MIKGSRGRSPSPLIFVKRVKGEKLNMSKKWYYKVANRSASSVVYRIPELNIRRTFAPGEVKILSFEELQKLSY
jgi:hypothetical protein